MIQYQMRIALLSDALIGSGEGYGAIIDADVVFDEFGIPFIPGKRIKGILRDSMQEVIEMVQSAGILKIQNQNVIDLYFGKPGQMISAPLFISNFFICEYQKNRRSLKNLIDKYPKVVTRESIINHFTVLRQQTAISENTGTAKTHSLRSLRVLKKGLDFYGTIELNEENQDLQNLLALSCANLRKIGTSRNRGLGDVECKLYVNSKEIPVESILGGK
jgi:CRISPR-associated protein Csx10